MSRQMPAGWAIIADDLTGAADAAAVYGPSHSSSVVLDLKGEWPRAEILAIDTESRYLPEEQAASVVEYTAIRALGLGHRVFKKIDSLLRGNVGVELAAAASALGGSAMTIVSPAFPATGRITANGMVHVNGVPSEDAKFGGNVCQALATGGPRGESVVISEKLQQYTLARRLTDLYRGGVRTVVVDAESDQDLRVIVQASELLDIPTLLAGSGGLAGHVALRKEAHNSEFLPLPLIGPTLLVIGSYSPLAKRQVQELVAAGVWHVKLDHKNLSDPKVHTELSEALARGHAVLTPDPCGILDKSKAYDVAVSLASATATVRSDCGVLVLSGGETAAAVLAELGVTSFTVLSEIEPGLVASHVHPGFPLLVTKAGTFGDERTLLRISQFLDRTTIETRIK